MNFLSPSILWGLFALLIPLIIHLLNRRRFRTVKWAATSFLLKASRESRGKKRLKHILILTCRALAVAALVTAVARPLIGGFLGWGGGAIETVVLVLDRSASMELKPEDGQPSQREAVIQRIAGALEEMGSPRLILIDSASGEIQDVPSPDVLPEISSTQATDTQGNIPVLLMKAVDYLQETSPGKSEIWLASDLQRADWNPTDSRWQAVHAGIQNLPTETRLRILTNQRKDTQNLSIELLASRRVEDELFLDLKLSRTIDTGETAIPITYSLKGSRSAERITMEGQELRFQKRLPLSKMDDKGYGWIGIPPDHNPRDNAAFYAFGGKEPVNTWIVTNDPEGESAQYLKKAAAPPGFERYSCEIISPKNVSEIEWASATLIIWQAPLPSGVATTMLTQFVDAGGAALFFPSEEESPEAIFGINWGKIIESPEDQFFINGAWTRDDGPWRDGATGNPLPVSQLRAIKKRLINGDGAAMAQWDDQSPLVLRKLQGRGVAVFVGTQPIDTWSNLEFTALHLVTVQRMIEEGMNRLHSGYRTTAGSEKAQTANEEVRQRLDTFEEFDPALESYRAGVYQLGDRVLAVNRPAEESSPELVSEEALTELMADTPYSLFEEQNSKNSLVQEAWRLFLIAVLFFLIAEALLCLQPKPTKAP